MAAEHHKAARRSCKPQAGGLHAALEAGVEPASPPDSEHSGEMRQYNYDGDALSIIPRMQLLASSFVTPDAVGNQNEIHRGAHTRLSAQKQMSAETHFCAQAQIIAQPHLCADARF